MNNCCGSECECKKETWTIEHNLGVKEVKVFVDSNDCVYNAGKCIRSDHFHKKESKSD